jgi:hypothetical protein
MWADSDRDLFAASDEDILILKNIKNYSPTDSA